jgi:hypothetical protein
VTVLLLALIVCLCGLFASTANKEAYVGSAQITASLASLATGTAWESASRNVSTNLEFDDWIALTFTISSGSPSTTGPTVNVYANGSIDGTLWPIIQLSSGAPKATAGTDASIGALGTPPNLFLIGSFGIQTTSSSGNRTFRTQPFSVAQAFGGNPPTAYSVLIENQTGVSFASLTATTANYLEVNGVFTTSGN